MTWAVCDFDNSALAFCYSRNSPFVTDYSSYSPRLSNSLFKVTATTSSQRVVLGTTSSSIAIGSASSPAGSLQIDTQKFSNNYDTVKLLVYSTGTASVTIKGQDNTTLTAASDNLITLIPTTLVTSGLNFIEVTIAKGSLYNDIMSKIEVTYVCSSGTVDLYFDSIKFSHSSNFNIYYGLISRSVLSTPIVKTAEESVDIEYEIYLYS